MTDRERYLAYQHRQTEGVPMCATCTHYVQHYSYDKRIGYRPICIGHCCTPRIKERMPYDLCKHYDPKED